MSDLAPVSRIYQRRHLAQLSLGEQLRRWRQHHGLSQAALGRMLGGARQPHVSRWELGKVTPGDHWRRRIAELTGIDLAA